MLLSFPKIIAQLNSAYRIHSTEQAAFRARLRYFQRLDWPRGCNFGPGRRQNWTERHYLDLVMAAELTMLGFGPERAIEIMKANYITLLDAATNGGTCEIRVPPLFGDALPRSTIRMNLSAAKAEPEKIV